MKNYIYMFSYVRFDEYDMNSYRNEYLRLLGGQSHAQCEFHITPLIKCYKNLKFSVVRKMLFFVVVKIVSMFLFVKSVLMI